jgi:DNA (cytosine-5)-methyltransferase 1
MTAYYNEIDPYAAQWLRNLIAAGHVAPGYVDERSIVDVDPGELNRYLQCHFFAGIGGWSIALRIAGWPDDRRVWTGSCPCQPLSSAGQRKGHADERHLWPAFYRLIAQRRPSTVFGEQVASKDGREWLAGVRADLEALGYACGAADLCAAGVSAPHIRQRLYWCANSLCSERWTPAERRGDDTQRPNAGRQEAASRSGLFCSPRHRPSDTDARREECGSPQCDERPMEMRHWEDVEWIAAGDEGQFRIKPGLSLLAHGIRNRIGRLRAYGNAIVPQVAAEFITASVEAISG